MWDNKTFYIHGLWDMNLYNMKFSQYFHDVKENSVLAMNLVYYNWDEFTEE